MPSPFKKLKSRFTVLLLASCLTLQAVPSISWAAYESLNDWAAEHNQTTSTAVETVLSEQCLEGEDAKSSQRLVWQYLFKRIQKASASGATGALDLIVQAIKMLAIYCTYTNFATGPEISAVLQVYASLPEAQQTLSDFMETIQELVVPSRRLLVLRRITPSKRKASEQPDQQSEEGRGSAWGAGGMGDMPAVMRPKVNAPHSGSLSSTSSSTASAPTVQRTIDPKVLASKLLSLATPVVHQPPTAQNTRIEVPASKVASKLLSLKQPIEKTRHQEEDQSPKLITKKINPKAPASNSMLPKPKKSTREKLGKKTIGDYSFSSEKLAQLKLKQASQKFVQKFVQKFGFQADAGNAKKAKNDFIETMMDVYGGSTGTASQYFANAVSRARDNTLSVSTQVTQLILDYISQSEDCKLKEICTHLANKLFGSNTDYELVRSALQPLFPKHPSASHIRKIWDSAVKTEEQNRSLSNPSLTSMDLTQQPQVSVPPSISAQQAQPTLTSAQIGAIQEGYDDLGAASAEAYEDFIENMALSYGCSKETIEAHLPKD